MSSRICVLLVTAAASLAGCEKSSSKEPTPSGALSSSDKDVFRHFPSGAQVLFGGNYGKLQKFMENVGGGGKASGTAKLIECVATKDGVKFAGAVTATGKRSMLRMAVGGLTPADVEGCAKSTEGVTFTPSDDGTYFTLASDGDKGGIAFLKLKDGTLFTRAEVGGGSPMSMLSPKFKATPREDLEADVAAAAKASAADDAKLNDVAAKVDRSKTLWFAGSLDGVDGKLPVGEAFGSMDIGDGFSLFMSAQITDSSKADQLERYYDQAKSMADQLPGGLKAVFEEMKLKRNDDRFTLHMNLSTDQILQAAKSASALGIGRRGGF